MNKSTGIICLILLTLLIAPAAAATLYVDDDGGEGVYTTIGAAVTAAADGDGIIVKDGTYTENVQVDKLLCICSENGAGAVTVTAASPAKPVFNLAANGVTVEGFTVCGPGDWGGVEIVGFKDCTVRKNDVSGCYNGIHIGGDASGNTVEENYCHENDKRGLSVRDTATGNLLFNNTCEKNAEDQICIKDAANNNIIWANAFNGTVELRTANIYHSSAEVTYTYGSKACTGHVGNYYSRYTGADADTNGIGDTPMSFGTYKDEYPMMGLWRNGEITGGPIDPADLVIAIAGAPGCTGEGADVAFEDTVTVTNNGTATAEAFSVFLYATLTSEEEIVVGNLTVESLAGGGAAADLTFTWEPPRREMKMLRAVVDAGEVVTETNETNNEATFTITPPSYGGTTEVTVIKHAENGTVVNSTTVHFRWMERNLPVLGDGKTRYYHQGPVFENEWKMVHPNEPYDKWNPTEDVNLVDYGVMRGTDVRDLCDLVGGMTPGDRITVRARDGWKVSFGYVNIYEYEARQGPLVLTWEADGKKVPGGYRDGMRVFFFADNSTNPHGWHVFGIDDMVNCLRPSDWHFYEDEPSPKGISTKFVKEIHIYTRDPPAVERIVVKPELADVFAGEVQQFVAICYDQYDDVMKNIPVTWSFSNETVGEIEQDGLYTGHAIGTAHVVATVEGVNGTATVFPTEIVAWADPCESAAGWTGTNFLVNDAKFHEGRNSISSGWSTKNSLAERTIIFPERATTLSFDAYVYLDRTVDGDWAKIFLDDTEIVEGKNDGSMWKNYVIDISGYAPGEHTFRLQTHFNESSSKYRYLSVGVDDIRLMAARDVPTGPPVATLYVDDDGGDGIYTTISDAVAASNAGDTIVVKDGVYTENVLVDKLLVIRTENGAGAVTVTAATTGKPVFDVNADGVTVEGFAVRGPTDEHVAGIEIVGFDDCIVRKNDCAGCYNGIHLGGDATGNTVEENYCHENSKRGLSLRDTVAGNLVFNNTCENNAEAEICIKDSAKGNTVWANAFLGPVEIKTANTYHSPEEVTYTYRGGEYTGYVGNHYSRYTGIDDDTNGIGDTSMSFGTYKDDYPMMGEWQNGVISAPAPELTTITLDPTTAGMTVGDGRQFTATARNQYGEEIAGTKFTWTSSNNAVATVNATGYVEAVAAGTATITATSGEVSGTAEVTVSLAPAELTTIVIEPATASLTVGDGRQFTATARNQYGEEIAETTFTWTSSNTAGATVNATGYVEAVAAGTATITATSGEVSGTAEVTVSAAPSPEFTALTLKKGWNFVSVPRTLAPGNDTALIFADVDSAGHSILAFDAAAGLWKTLGENDIVRPLDGIWVYAAESTTVEITVDPAKPATPPTKHLAEGWNAIGFSDIAPEPARDALTSVKDTWAILIGFDAEKQAYEHSAINGATGTHADTCPMIPGKGYWLYMRADGTLAAIST
ncbi:hypothetical protein E2N92_04525 [Methanofollis formosanus]|uniref:BIG2 domain-containing protein n=1 Tax=Methanofollis formosanus TaxID=299308 RepID=A0A8G1A1D4_9EURY|nr:Ig-like domain-containing protein [Methanofollis formosanus]QYZ78745.1 hypothetical protein E2N92_04525 [Methanofollis formosanus]